ncbi:helix-turn-helix domain-containing protein [Zobellia laminariae]|uniref:helix-turn-helix domain-containing protein n=1 Tax=Zobellia laminariae TaxID=248906 RepID=UPI0012D8F343|nr:AraC family transcriptional regulator [Zobellia laminariae]
MHTVYPVPKALYPFVSFFYEIKWERKEYEEDIKEFALPSGMGFMVFQFSGRIYGTIGNKEPNVPKYYTIGQQLNTYTIKSDDETVELTGVAFKPAGLRKLFGFDMNAMVNNPTNTANLLGIDLTKFTQELEKARCPEERISMVEQLLLEKVDRAIQTCPAVDIALDMIYDSQGCIQIQDITDKLNVSIRYFQKKFKEVTGISPSAFNRIVRFNNLFSEFNLGTESDYARLSALFNYYDFSHFYRDFKKYCGESPSEFHIERFNFIQETFIKDPLFVKYAQTI